MKKKRTPLNLSVIISKIQSRLGSYVESAKNEKHDRLISTLGKIGTIIEPFVWLDINARNELDYSSSVPVMADMIEWINEFDIVDELHNWHYQDHNTTERLDELNELASHFLSFIDKELN